MAIVSPLVLIIQGEANQMSQVRSVCFPRRMNYRTLNFRRFLQRLIRDNERTSSS